MEGLNPWSDHSSKSPQNELIKNPFAEEFERENEPVDNPFKDEFERELQQQQQQQQESNQSDDSINHEQHTQLDQLDHVQPKHTEATLQEEGGIREHEEAAEEEEEDEEIFVYPGAEEDEDEEEEEVQDPSDQPQPQSTNDDDEDIIDSEILTPHASNPKSLLHPTFSESLPSPGTTPQAPSPISPVPTAPKPPRKPVDPTLLPPPLPLASTITQLIAANDLKGLKKVLTPSDEVVEAWEEREGMDWPGAWKLSNETEGGKGKIGGLGLAAKR
jgi:hypothetical protein